MRGPDTGEILFPIDLATVHAFFFFFFFFFFSVLNFYSSEIRIDTHTRVNLLIYLNDRVNYIEKYLFAKKESTLDLVKFPCNLSILLLNIYCD